MRKFWVKLVSLLFHKKETENMKMIFYFCHCETFAVAIGTLQGDSLDIGTVNLKKGDIWCWSQDPWITRGWVSEVIINYYVISISLCYKKALSTRYVDYSRSSGIESSNPWGQVFFLYARVCVYMVFFCFGKQIWRIPFCFFNFVIIIIINTSPHLIPVVLHLIFVV